MDNKDRPQEDIIELIDIIEESEDGASSSSTTREISGDADDLEDLFLFPGAADAGHSLLDEIDDRDQGSDDDFPELDAIFEDLESAPEVAPTTETVRHAQSGEPHPVSEQIRELVAAAVREATEPFISLLEEQGVELEKVDRAVSDLQDPGVSRAGVAEMIDGALQERDSAQAGRIAELEQEVQELRRELQTRDREVDTFLDADSLTREMDARIEKAVPAAAARIIREEISNLLKSGI
ncbi:MAG TPA: hypothetical protein VJ934_02600 [Desulfomicrobiaceae bacterium]|nr:hypothetical protein [Desulfomicrobiaceae bacterium]